jgi:hypothetical protein
VPVSNCRLTLSDEFGILTEEDMHDKGFLEDIGKLGTEPTSAPRWICFETKNFSSKCINISYSEKFNADSGDLEMIINQDKKEFRLGFDSIISNETCEEHRTAWMKIMKDEKYFCLSSTLLAIDEKDSNKITGFFYKLKTKKGCDSWFVGSCN